MRHVNIAKWMQSNQLVHVEQWDRWVTSVFKGNFVFDVSNLAPRILGNGRRMCAVSVDSAGSVFCAECMQQ